MFTFHVQVKEYIKILSPVKEKSTMNFLNVTSSKQISFSLKIVLITTSEYFYENYCRMSAVLGKTQPSFSKKFLKQQI